MRWRRHVPLSGQFARTLPFVASRRHRARSNGARCAWTLIPLSLHEESGQKESNMQHENVIQVLNDPLAQELLNSAIPARLAYTGRDGFPRVIPIGFYWNGTQFFVCTAPNAPKVRALAANPKVALTIDTDTFPPHVLLVRG